jgi:hypothetical protein
MKATGINSWQTNALCAMSVALSAMSLGCSATPIGLAMHVAGEAVNDVDEQQRSQELVGQPMSVADAKLGAPADVLSDTRSTRVWRLYNVPMDPMKTSRYVLEVNGDTVVAVEKVQQYSDPVEYAATLAVLEPTAMGKSPAECEANLKMGPSLLTVRSQVSGQLIQLYDARLVKELQSPHYCVLRFGAANTCERINLVKAYTATGG